MAKPKLLLIGSTAACSGKSATILGLGHQLQAEHIKLAYGKPLGTYFETGTGGQPFEADLRFVADTLQLPDSQLHAPFLALDPATLRAYLRDGSPTDYTQVWHDYAAAIAADLALLEGPSTLTEGRLFNLSIEQMATSADAAVLLVVRYDNIALVDDLLDARLLFGDRLFGVLINDVPEPDLAILDTELRPFLERQGIPVFGLLPRNALLRSVSVRELTKQLQAKVLCREDRLDLMVESLTIGAMNVNSALEYFRRERNMAVVTGGDRSELQMAALETSTNCLILTGHTPPPDFILSRAEDLEVPILSVDLDTLSTVEIADRAFGQVRMQEPIKVQCMQELIAKHFDTQRFLANLGLEPAAVS
ncbi:MAG: phosphotransacetylase family protein [Spirulinaceae cyanobacterium SM2_1_0]|nr:phosphotransacetylase family protein [Spirulinaceae cyanobacterium SM2_1_0]